MEGHEQCGQILARNPPPLVGHRHHHLARLHLQPYRNLRARQRELDGIAQQVPQHLRDAAGVSLQGWDLLGYLDLETVLRRQSSAAFHGLAYEARQVDLLPFQRQAPGLGLGSLQKILNQGVDPFGLLCDHLQATLQVLGWAAPGHLALY